MADGTDENFRALHQRFDGVDRRLDAVEAKLVGHDQRFDAVDAKLTAHDRSFEEFARTMDALRREFAEQVARSDAQFREILGHFDAVYHRLDRIEQEYMMIKEGIRRVEAMLLDDQGKREALERRLAGLKTDVVALQARIEALERRLRE